MGSKRGYIVFISAIILLILLVSLAVLYNRPNEPGEQQDSCRIDSDCVAATCCHPADAVNEKYAPDCTGVACTLVCSGPLDCGAGEIKCADNKCKIVPTETNYN